MEIRVKTINEDGSVLFDGMLNQKEVQFVLEVGVNFLLANGAQPFLEDDDEDTIEAPGSETVQ